jgi:Cu/Zn superoxide dismutase
MSNADGNVATCALVGNVTGTLTLTQRSSVRDAIDELSPLLILNQRFVVRVQTLSITGRVAALSPGTVALRERETQCSLTIEFALSNLQLRRAAWRACAHVGRLGQQLPQRWHALQSVQQGLCFCEHCAVSAHRMRMRARQTHGGPTATERHFGDFGNIFADESGEATVRRRHRCRVVVALTRCNASNAL